MASDSYGSGDSGSDREGVSASDEADVAPERSDEDILTEARARFKIAEEAEAETRALASKDLKFRTGDQWDPRDRADRIHDKRPCLTINRLPQHMQQVTNDQRQNRPSLKVHPVDNEADPETAKIIQGLFRHIEYNSSADAAYDTAFEGTVGEGLGYFRVITDYADPLSFDQEILIKRVRDRFTVYFDPHSQEPDGSDANWAFIADTVSREEYRALFPESKLSTTEGWETLGQQTPEWVTKDSVRVVEYLYKEFKNEPICLLSSGQVVRKSELPKIPESLGVDESGQPVTVTAERVARVPTIKWCKINGPEILERTTLPGFWIPVIPVYGTEHVIDGKRVLKGITRDAMDSQRIYNVMKSAEMEAIGLAPKAPFVGYAGQFDGFEKDWETANRRNHAYLEVNPVMVNGAPAPLPQRMSVEPAVMAITQSAMGAAEDIKATTGLPDAARGMPSNETSGRAILARANQAQTGNFHYVDNLTRSMKHLGRILIAWIPSIYDAERVVRIIGEDGTQRRVTVNGPAMENGKPIMGPDGKPVVYDLSVGKYDVTVDVGPSYQTKRQEGASAMLELAKTSPQVMQSAPDLLVGNMDFAGAKDVAERLKKTLPPGLADDPKNGQQPIPPQVKAQMEQMGKMVEGLTAQLNELQSERETKILELESKERIENAKVQAEIEIALAKMGSQEAIELLRQEIAQLDARMSLLRVDEPVDPQDSAPPVDGAYGAPVDDMAAAEPPTGGESPGLPIEGM